MVFILCKFVTVLISQKAILDLLYELLWLPQPQWTDEYSVAINAVDPADYHDSWRLSEGFVAMEGKNILPSLANRVSNIAEIHTSILLYCFLEAGILNALIDVVVSSATFISVRATILIGMQSGCSNYFGSKVNFIVKFDCSISFMSLYQSQGNCYS